MNRPPGDREIENVKMEMQKMNMSAGVLTLLLAMGIAAPVFAGDPPEGSSGGQDEDCWEECVATQTTGYNYDYCTEVSGGDCSCCATVYECCLYGVCSTQPFGMSARDWVRACHDGGYTISATVECFPATPQLVCSSDMYPR